MNIPASRYWISSLEKTPAGSIYIAASPAGIAGIAFGRPQPGWGDPLPGSSALLEQAVVELREYFDGTRSVFTLGLDLPPLNSFHRRALELTAAIPFGQVRRYGQLAAELGNPAAARAVGGALAANRIPILIPCHRVVGADGSLRGFASPEGISTKAMLLQLEGRRVAGGRLVAEG